MKAVCRCVLIGIAAPVLFAGCSTAPRSSSINDAGTTGQAANSDNSKVIAETTDGSRIVGTWSTRKLSAETAFSKNDIETALLQSIALEADKPAHLFFKNGDNIHAKLNLDAIKLETSFGSFNIPLNVVSRISFGGAEEDQPRNLSQPTWPVLSPVLFDVSSAAAKKETGVAQGPSGRSLDGISYNGPAWTNGTKDRALEFNGANQYVSLGNILQGRYTNFSIACWVKHPGSSWQNIVERGAWDYPDGIGLLMDYFGQSVDFGHYNNFVKSKTTVQDNQWHHVVGTMAQQGENYIYSIYVDGKLDNTSAPLPVGMAATTKAWTIGARYNGSWLYRGLIGNVRLYERTLSAAEVQDLYSQSKP